MRTLSPAGLRVPPPTLLPRDDSRSTGFRSARRCLSNRRSSNDSGREYLGLKLDDPSFAAPIYANLFDDEDGEGYSLIWSRPNGNRGD